MRILGIDPGYDRCGVAIVERDGGKDTLLFSTCLSSPRGVSFEIRLLTLARGLRAVIDMHKPTVMALETLFMTNNKLTAMKVAEARGMIQLVGAEKGLTIRELGPGEVKLAITGYGKSDKAAMMVMITRLTGIKKRAYDDEFDAIAVALAASATSRYPHAKK